MLIGLELRRLGMLDVEMRLLAEAITDTLVRGRKQVVISIFLFRVLSAN
jgi:hypothetical protein